MIVDVKQHSFTLTFLPSAFGSKVTKNVAHLRIILEKPSLFCRPSRTFVILTNPKLIPYTTDWIENITVISRVCKLLAIICITILR